MRKIHSIISMFSLQFSFVTFCIYALHELWNNTSVKNKYRGSLFLLYCTSSTKHLLVLKQMTPYTVLIPGLKDKSLCLLMKENLFVS